MPSTERLRALADRCVACGLCAPACPTYREAPTEADAPRGRILIARAALAGFQADAAALRHIDRCVGCRACEAVCPNQVQVTTLLAAMRPRLPGKSSRDKAALRVLRFCAAHSRALSLLRPLAAAARFLPGLRRFAPSAGLCLPLTIAPSPSAAPRGKVALFLGCFARLLDGDTLRAAAALLSRGGFAVDIPPDQGCCGALALDAGDAAAFAAMRARNESAFADAPRIAHCASGCAAMLTTAYGDDFAGRITDASRLIADNLDALPPPMRRPESPVFLHIPCTQRNGASAAADISAAQAVVAAASGELSVDLPENDRCCGAGGGFFIAEPKMAARLRRKKIAAIGKAAGAGESFIVATANYGCARHIGAALSGGRIIHPLALLAESLGECR